MKSCNNILSDYEQIVNAIVSYGIYVDICDYEAVANLWLDDGEYTVMGVGRWVGHDELKEMVKSEMHQEYVRNGCIHFMGQPHVKIEGNKALAINNTLLIKNSPEGFIIDRASNNLWDFRKTDSGWKILRRENTLIAPK